MRPQPDYSGPPNPQHPMLTWAKENLARGCAPSSMLQPMLDTGMPWREAAQVLGAAEAFHAASLAPARPPVWAPSPSRSLFGASEGSRMRVALHLEDPEVALVENFLDAQEASELIGIAKERLARSTTVPAGDLTGTMVHPARSSSGFGFSDYDHPLSAKLRSRAGAAFGCPTERIEGLQILRYLPGQEYKHHQDFFEPAAASAPAHMARGGQRLATFVAYLNDCPEGGATVFPVLGIRSSPILGNGIFFSYPGDGSLPDARLLHGGEPVLSGEKWVCTFWMRQGKAV